MRSRTTAVIALRNFKIFFLFPIRLSTLTSMNENGTNISVNHRCNVEQDFCSILNGSVGIGARRVNTLLFDCNENFTNFLCRICKP